MSTCSKCGKELNKTSGLCEECGSGQSRPEASLDRKKARVMEHERPRIKPAIIAGAVVIIAAVIWIFVSNNRTGASMNNQGTVQAQTASSVPSAQYESVTVESGSARVPLPALDDKRAHFYRYDSGGKTIKFFILRASDGSVRAAFDACTACYHAKRGYRQEGDDMICNNCGMHFKSTNIEIITGGCNPIPVKKILDQKTALLKVKDLEAGAKYF
jgi:uncharacterized membrane protein